MNDLSLVFSKCLSRNSVWTRVESNANPSSLCHQRMSGSTFPFRYSMSLSGSRIRAPCPPLDPTATSVGDFAGAWANVPETGAAAAAATGLVEAVLEDSRAVVSGTTSWRLFLVDGCGAGAAALLSLLVGLGPLGTSLRFMGWWVSSTIRFNRGPVCGYSCRE